MDLLEYRNYLVGQLERENAEEPDAGARHVLNDLVKHLREMDVTDQYMLEAWKAHGQLTDQGLQREALTTALDEYRSYNRSEQLPTMFLIDLLHAAQPEEGFL